MGNWTIVIEGTGSHGEENNPGSADKLLLEFVSVLKENGQHLQHVSFTESARKVLEKVGLSHRYMPG